MIKRQVDRNRDAPAVRPKGENNKKGGERGGGEGPEVQGRDGGCKERRKGGRWRVNDDGEASGCVGAGVECAGDSVVVEGICKRKHGAMTEASAHETGLG